MSVLFRGGSVLDTEAALLLHDHEVLVEGNRIKEVSDRSITAPEADVVDLRGGVLMPGLIDAHVHICASELNITSLAQQTPSYVTARSTKILKSMLARGFTSVRDTGGADWGIRDAVNSGVLAGPRLFIAGRMLSQTGGHGDFRSQTANHDGACDCCGGLGGFTHIADGVSEVLRAAREELRRGCDCVKIMISGGVASPHDPLESLQYTIDEIRAAVDAAESWGKYAAAHAYSAEAIRRGVECGVRSIEHGNFIDEPTARIVVDHHAFVVPTLVTYDGMARRGRELGMSERNLSKNKKVLEHGLRSLEICKAAGIELGFGSDLLGALHDDQSREFLIRAEVQSPAEIIRSATVANARLLCKEGELGIVRSGAFADLLVVNGNPLNDLNLLQQQGAHIPVIMKDGIFYKRETPSTDVDVFKKSSEGTARAASSSSVPPAMTLTILGFPDGGEIPVKFTQAAPGVPVGEGTSPAIRWANKPSATRTFLLNMHDMDVVLNMTTDDQVHWVVWNIPASAGGLPEGVPKGSQLPDGGYQISVTGPMYRGPGAPADGPLHHYVFELYALDTELDVKPSSDAVGTRANLISAIEGHILAKAVYGGRFRAPR